MMEENRRIFGYIDSVPVEEITLSNGYLQCGIITYGGAVRSLMVPDKKGDWVDVVLGFDTLEDYRKQDKYMGALVGRYANRIGGAKFTLNGVEYKLAANDGPNSLHGGKVGFDKRIWTVEELKEREVTLSLVSPDMEENYPGALEVRVTYALDLDTLRIQYWAKSDKDTVFNPTNHSYFNLSGHNKGSVEKQYIRVFGSYYTPVGAGLISTGEIAPVDGTPMDLREFQPIGQRINEDFEQLIEAGGYDHNWIIAPPDSTLAAAAYAEDTGIAMTVHTTLPGVQFYAGNFIGGCPAGKGGAVYGDRHGFCLETQFFPDSPNKPGFPSCVLKAGEEFRQWTNYRFLPLSSLDRP